MKYPQKSHPTHGLSHTKEYRIWQAMISRCYKPTNASYHKYGGRGITVCDRWLNSVQAFIDDMGICPPDKTSIDRIDNSLGYFPENCRWADDIEQNNNRKNVVMLTINGITKSRCNWAREYGISPITIKSRMGRGWSAERAVTEPKHNYPDIRKKVIR